MPNTTTAWEGAAASVQYAVRLGTWTNWSRGRVMGATLTVSRADGNYLLSFTAFFISMVSVRFWHIACFLIHNHLSTPAPRDALHHQRQVVLRNSGSAASHGWMMLQLAWAWRRRAAGGWRRLLARTLPVATAAAFCAAAFTVAGGFSSQISTGVGREVLLDGSNCGILYTQSFLASTSTSIGLYVADAALNADNYAQQCYSANVSRTFDCTSFVKPRLPSTVDYDAPCPFDSGLCRSDAGNIRLDTGYIDSREHLGINSPADERILFRSTLHCAPLATEGYSEDSTTSGGNYTHYYYGPKIKSAENSTYDAPAIASQYNGDSDGDFSGRGLNLILAPVIVHPFNGTPNTGDADIYPIPELFREDADLLLVFLVGNGVMYKERNNDPWYRGMVPGGNWSRTGVNESLQAYRPEEAASPLGCLQQYQFCNGDEDHCGPTTGWVDAQVFSAPVFNVSVEEEMGNGYAYENPTGDRYQWFDSIIGFVASDISGIVSQLGVFSLSSQQYLEGSLMGLIPDNQWQLDVEHWWATWLAAIQASVVTVAVGTSVKALQPYTLAPYGQYVQNAMCENQKVLSSDYTSFSLLGLCLTYVLGAVVVALSFSLEAIQGGWCLRRRVRRGDGTVAEYARLEWAANETLQLQRAAYQGLGEEEGGAWDAGACGVPTTAAGELLGDLARGRYADGDGAGSRAAAAAAGREKAGPVDVVTRAARTSASREASGEVRRRDVVGGGDGGGDVPQEDGTGTPETVAEEVIPREALLQEALPQEALPQEASPQETLTQEPLESDSTRAATAQDDAPRNRVTS